MWSVLVQEMLEEENPALYRKMQMDGTLEDYVKGNAAIMADAVKSLSPRGDPVSRSEAHEIVIAEMRAQIRLGTEECDEEGEDLDIDDALEILEAFGLGIDAEP